MISLPLVGHWTMRLVLMTWLVARPVAAATACLYAHGDGEPARALTCVSVLPPAAAAVAAGSGGEGRTPVARCSRRWLLSQACRDGGTGAAEAVVLVDAPRGDGIRERRLAGTYVVEHGVCRRAAAAPPANTSVLGTAHACARRCAAALACRAWSWLAATGACSLLGANASTVVEATLRRDCASGVVDGPAFEVRDAVVPGDGARVCSCRGGCVFFPGTCGARTEAPPDAAALAALCAGTPSAAVAVVVAQVYGAAYAHFLLDNLSRWAQARAAAPSAALVRVTAPGHGPRRRKAPSAWNRLVHPTSVAKRAAARDDPLHTRPAMVALLGDLGAPRSRVTTAPGPFAAALVPAPISCSHLADAHHGAGASLGQLLALRHALGADALRAAAGPVDVLVLRRTGTRAIANHDELVAALRRAGLATRVFDAARLPAPRRQLAEFARATVVVGAHGAGLTNVVASPRCATVVEVRFRDNPRSLEALSETLGLTYVAVRAAPAPGAGRDPHRDAMVAPVAEIVQVAGDNARACDGNATRAA